MEIAHGIYRFQKITGANSYLYAAENGALVVIDTGMSGNAERIVEQLKVLGKRPDKVGLIILTHSDLDHAGSAARLRDLTGAKIAIHQADAPSLSGEQPLKKVRGALGIVFGLFLRFVRFPPVRPDIILSGGDKIEDLTVVHAPGHTMGSICLYKPGQALFVGDLLRTDRNGNPKASPKAMTLDSQMASESINRIAQLEFEVLLPGHGELITRAAAEKVRGLIKQAG